MKNVFRLACLLLLLLMGLSCGDQPDVYSLSIPNLKIEPDSTIISMEIRINAGTVQSVQSVPLGWMLTVYDNATWHTMVKGEATVGAASLSPEELGRVVFLVRRNESDTFRFDVSGTFVTSKNYSRNKTVEVTMKDFQLQNGQ